MRSPGPAPGGAPDLRAAETPTGRDRIGLAVVCAVGGPLAGTVAGFLAASAAYGLGAGLGGLLIGFGSGLLVSAVSVVWLCVRTGLGAAFGAIAALLVVIGVLGFASDSSLSVSIALVAAAALVLLGRLTDPGRRTDAGRRDRRGRAAFAVLAVLGIAVLGSIPLAVADLRTWRQHTRALAELDDPPLMPTAPGLDVRELRVTYDGVDYLVADSDGLAFATVRHQPVNSRPVVSDDCFSVLLDGPPMVGCAEVAPGVYRAEYRADRSNASFFLPRENDVIVVREHITGANMSKYGEAGPGDENLLRVATSLRPASVQDLARRDCGLCRLMPR